MTVNRRKFGKPLIGIDEVHEVEYSECSWKSADGTSLFTRLWYPDGVIKSAVCIVHGLGEHSGRFAHVAESFGREGIAVAAFDLRGHGKSDGKRGHTPSFSALLDDIGSALRQFAQLFPDVPLFLYGHSMGGNLVLNYVLRRKPELAGVISSAPWLKLAFEPPKIKVRFGRVVDRLWPSFSQSNGLKSKALSRSADIVDEYEADGLVHDRITARLYFSLRDAGAWAIEHAADIRIPVLIMHGSGDQITSCAASERFAEKAKEFSTLMIWKGFFHELHNDPFGGEVIDYMASWMKMTAGQTQVSKIQV
ncbi:MAG TPA: alpha/beta hydrolase [Bacilli bacterium]